MYVHNHYKQTPDPNNRQQRCVYAFAHHARPRFGIAKSVPTSAKQTGVWYVCVCHATTTQCAQPQAPLPQRVCNTNGPRGYTQDIIRSFCMVCPQRPLWAHHKIVNVRVWNRCVRHACGTGTGATTATRAMGVQQPQKRNPSLQYALPQMTLGSETTTNTK